jgi:hypothetical protein
MAAGRQGFQRKTTDTHTLRFFYRMSRLKQFVSERIAPRLRNGHLVPRSIRSPEPRNVRARKTAEFFDLFKSQQ